MAIKVTWKEKLLFSASVREKPGFEMDTKTVFGGTDKAPTPKEYLLAGLCGCTGMDVVGFLKKPLLKTKGRVSHFSIEAEATASKGQPSVFTEIVLHFIIQAEGLTSDEVKEAVTLSQTKYCGISAMLSKACPILYTITFNGENTGDGEADFSTSVPD